MKGEEFIAAIKTQRPDRKYLYYDEEYRIMLEVTRSICDSEIYYDVECGPFESFGVNNWTVSTMCDYHVFASYYHEYADGHITNEDFFELNTGSLIYKGMDIEPGDDVAPAEEYERSEKDAMWERKE